MSNVSGAVKSIQDIMRKDAGTATPSDPYASRSAKQNGLIKRGTNDGNGRVENDVGECVLAGRDRLSPVSIARRSSRAAV